MGVGVVVGSVVGVGAGVVGDGRGVGVGAGVTGGAMVGANVGTGGGRGWNAGCGVANAGAGVPSEGSADGDCRSDGLGEGVAVERVPLVGDGAPARTPSPCVARGSADSAVRPSASQLAPIATDPATSSNAAPAAAWRAGVIHPRRRWPTGAARSGGGAAAPTSIASSVSRAVAERRQRSHPAAWSARSRGGSSGAPDGRAASHSANRSWSSGLRVT